MLNILFVCYGNICRSPASELLFKKMLKEKGINDIYCESAATSTEEIGSGVYYAMDRLLKERGIDTSKKIARQITFNDLEKFDYIIAMDKNNLRDIERVTGRKNSEKVVRLLDFTENPRDIADPWYTRNFQKCIGEISEGLEAMLSTLIKKGC